eukprot:gene513-986_t
MMDPSEFEGIIKNLDYFDEDGDDLELDHMPYSKQKFEIDNEIDKMFGEISLVCHEARDNIEKWTEAGLTNMVETLEQQALEYTALKEDYVKRRKVLASKVKTFTSSFVETDNSESNLDWKSECCSLIQSFKIEFDQLSKICRFAENAFLSTFKSIQNVPDPVITLQNTLNTFSKSKELITSHRDFIYELYEIIHKNYQNNSILNNQIDTKINSNISEQDIKERIQAETTEIKTYYTVLLRNNEQNLRDIYDKKSFEIQQQYEIIIDQKNSEISSLLSAMNDKKQQSIDAEQNETYLKLEVQRRQNLEDKIHTLSSEIIQIQNINQQIEKNLQNSLLQIQILEDQNKKINKEFDQKNKIHLQEYYLLRNKNQDLQNQLNERPPMNLNSLANKIGIISILNIPSNNNAANTINTTNNSNNNENMNNNNKNGTTTNNTTSSSSSSLPLPVTWNDIEQAIISQIRKCNAEATSSRVQYQSLYEQHSKLLEEYTTTKNVLEATEATVQTLETDLLEAYRIINANNSTSSSGVSTSTSHNDSSSKGDDNNNDNDMSFLMNSSTTTTTTRTTEINKNNTKRLNSTKSDHSKLSAVVIDKDTDNNDLKLISSINNNDTDFAALINQDDEEGEEELMNQQQPQQQSQQQLQGRRRNYDDQVEREGVGFEGIDVECGTIKEEDCPDMNTMTKNTKTNNTTAVSAATSVTSADRRHSSMLHAVQSQRDRFMQQVRERDKDISSLRMKWEQMQSDVNTLQSENGELYKRLRLLRVSQLTQTQSQTQTQLTHHHTDTAGRIRQSKSTSTSIASQNQPSLSVKQSRNIWDDQDSRNGMIDTNTDMDMDNLEMKYQQNYEAQLDPFKLEEIDRNLVISRMTIFERSILGIIKFFMLDKWTRHALVFYLILIHIFAFGYVIQVLNPELINDVDQIERNWKTSQFAVSALGEDIQPDVS